MRNIAVSLVSIAALTACVANGQGFTNFGFESAEIVAVSTNANGSVNVATGNAIPGWTAFVGTSQLSVIAYDTPTSVTWPAVGLLGGPQAPAIEGNFDVGLFENGSITQTGLVPAASESLLFGVSFGGSQPFVVSLDGQDLSYIALSNEVNSSGVGYTIYGADVSGYAGQDETLAFSAETGRGGGGILDDIQFSTMIVPEPSAISLICLSSGILIYACRRLRKSRHSGKERVPKDTRSWPWPAPIPE